MPHELISHPDKVFFAERGETKGDLAEHYQRVAEPLMRTMGGRPVLLQRFPDGASGPSFFQKRVPKNVPDWLQTTVVSTPNGTTSQVVLGKVALGLAALGEEHLVRMADQLVWRCDSPPRGSAVDRARTPSVTITIMSSPGRT